MNQLGKYKLIRRLSVGGMGEVYLARIEGPAGFVKTVVVKCILKRFAQDQTFIDLFLNEAKLAALLAHPNVVQIFELGEIDGTWFIAMEYVNGHSLRTVLDQVAAQQKVLAPVCAARLCSQALQGLHYAHRLTNERGQPLHLVHRDISPDNIMLTFDGGVKLVDFGIAKARLSAERTGPRTGKLPYMAPEQVEARNVDARSDIYAMGVVLYELIAGRRPFPPTTDADALSNDIVQAKYPSVREANPSVPPDLALIIERAMAPKPEDRFGSAEEMAAALEQFIGAQASAVTTGQLAILMLELFGPAARMTPLPGSLPAAGTAQLGTASLKPGTVQLPDGEKSQLMPLPKGSIAYTEMQRSTRRRRGLAVLGIGGAVGLVAVAVTAFAVTWTPPSASPGEAQPSPGPAPAQVAHEEPAPAPTVSTPARVAETPPAPTPVAVQPAVTPVAEHVKPKERRGRVNVLVNPWAEVLVGGKNYGATPIDPLSLPAGPVVITLRNKELGVERNVKVNVKPSGTTELRVDLLSN